MNKLTNILFTQIMKENETKTWEKKNILNVLHSKMVLLAVKHSPPAFYSSPAPEISILMQTSFLLLQNPNKLLLMCLHSDTIINLMSLYSLLF